MSQASLPPAERWRDQLAQKLLEVIVHVPATSEPASQTPDARSRAIIRGAALKVAGASGTLALPPGPWGMLTVLPDLVTVWKIQAQMVAQRLAGRTASRWLPVVGALGVAAYAYRDTRRVGQTAIELFSREVVLADDPA
jgi:hypothetical protein